MNTLRAFIAIAFVLCGIEVSLAQNMDEKGRQSIKVHHVEKDFPVTSLDNKMWGRGEIVKIGGYWSGVPAPAGRHFSAALIWSEKALYVRFEANQAEPLVISDKPDISKKTRGLWDRDVCEIFIAPDKANRNKYLEFEIAPTGEWIDIGIHVTPKKRESDWDYSSGMESAVRIGRDTIVMAIKIPWKAFGRTPKSGEIWLGNLFRCVGSDPTRGYLSWKATGTKEPNFHVPSKFGELVFVK